MNRRDLFKFITLAPIALPALVRLGAWRQYACGGLLPAKFMSGYVVEAGGESIIPLRRGPGGRLGVGAVQWRQPLSGRPAALSVEVQMREHGLFDFGAGC